MYHILSHIFLNNHPEKGRWDVRATYFSVPPTAASAERGEASCRLNAAGNRGNITVVSLYHCTAIKVNFTVLSLSNVQCTLYSIQQINAGLTTHPTDKSPEVSVSITFESLLQQDQEYTMHT